MCCFAFMTTSTMNNISNRNRQTHTYAHKVLKCYYVKAIINQQKCRDLVELSFIQIPVKTFSNRFINRVMSLNASDNWFFYVFTIWWDVRTFRSFTLFTSHISLGVQYGCFDPTAVPWLLHVPLFHTLLALSLQPIRCEMNIGWSNWSNYELFGPPSFYSSF